MQTHMTLYTSRVLIRELDLEKSTGVESFSRRADCRLQDHTAGSTHEEKVQAVCNVSSISSAR